MTPASPCPSNAELRAFVLGTDTEAEAAAVESHLSACPSCLRRLDGLPAADDLLLALRSPAAADTLDVLSPKIETLIARLRPLGAAPQAETEAQAPPAGESQPTQPLPEAFGRYRVRRLLGAGGMGTVYAAEDPALGRLVAVKVPRREWFGSDPEQAQARFLREARAAARVRHPNVCAALDVGTQDGLPYVVLDLIEGPSLRDRLRDGPPVEPRQAVEWARQIAEALAAVHAAGLIHRDVKPANVLLATDGRAVLTDFGVARPDDAEPLTSDGLLVGTPAYASPEQISGEGVGPHSDLYALGLVLYQILAGRLPFDGAPRDDAPPAPSQWRPGLDPRLDAITMKALAPRPEGRYASASEMADDLARYLSPVAGGEKRPATVRVELPDGRPVTVQIAEGVPEGGKVKVNVRERPAKKKGLTRWAVSVTVTFSLLLAVSLVVLTPGLLTFRGTSVAREEVAYQVALEDAKAAETAKQWADAVVAYKAALAAKPNDAAAMAGEKAAQDELIKIEDARKKEALYLAAMKDARAAETQERWAEAMEAYDQALQNRQGDKAATDARKLAAAKLARAELARKEEAYRAAMQQAVAAMKAKRYDEASLAYAKALRLEPNDPAALAGREAAQEALESVAMASKEEAYRRAMRKAETAMKAKKYDEAHEAYALALKTRPQDIAALDGVRQATKLIAQQPQKLFREGMDAYLGLSKEVDQARALALFRQAAEKKRAVAAGWAGYLTYQGRGTEKDEAEGLKLVEQALPSVRKHAEDGDADAQTLLGTLCAEGLGVRRDDDEAARWYVRAADKADPLAMNNLGVAYEVGRGVNKDDKMAVEWYQKAADKGEARAMANLGVMYQLGRGGLNKDDKKAVEWYQKAADKGVAAAQLYLGAAYEEGRGVDKDTKEALKWYKKAAAQGHQEAKKRVEKLSREQ